MRHLGAASALGALGVFGACDTFDAPPGPDGTTPVETPIPHGLDTRATGGGTMGSEQPPS